jgi:hypothetical protein
MAIKTEVKGTNLIVTIDISKGAIENAKPSSSGKTLLVATTNGNVPVAGCSIEGFKLALNAYVPNPAYVK